MDVFLSPNGNDIKICWKNSVQGAALAKPYHVNAPALRSCSHSVRAVLDELNEYVRGNPKFDEKVDPSWEGYISIMNRLKNEGGLLRSALIDGGEPLELALTFDRRIKQLPPDTEVTFHCSDQDVTIPLGFIFEGTERVQPRQPSRADFDGFWINHMKLGIRLSGTDCATSTPIDCSSFKTLYALNKKDKDDVLADFIDSNMEMEREQFESLTTIALRDHYDWTDVRHECEKMKESHAVFFVFAHSDGKSLQLDKSDVVDWAKFRTILRSRAENKVGLVILNCCASAVGAEGNSLLTTVSQPGICGMIGTEAQVINSFALRCGIHLMWNLCANGKKLGDAFTEMQNAEALFPINLFYTCYAARDFQLESPLKLPMAEMQ